MLLTMQSGQMAQNRKVSEEAQTQLYAQQKKSMEIAFRHAKSAMMLQMLTMKREAGAHKISEIAQNMKKISDELNNKLSN